MGSNNQYQWIYGWWTFLHVVHHSRGIPFFIYQYILMWGCNNHKYFQKVKSSPTLPMSKHFCFPFFFSNTPRDINSNELRRCFGLPSEVVRSSRISFSFTGFHKNLFSKKYWLHFWCSVQRPQHVQMLAKGKKKPDPTGNTIEIDPYNSSTDV